MRDPYLYDDVDVMKNKLGIKDKIELDEAEATILPIRLGSLNKFDEGKFDFEKLKEMHKHILGDIYEWAGKPRTIDIEKEERVLGGKSVEYSSHESIEKEAKKVIDEINKVDWKNSNLDKKADELAKLTAKLWQVHAFREGNTRTTISFIQSLAKSQGIEMNKELFKQNAGFVRNALVVASIGEYSDYSHLKNVIKDSIKEEEPIKEPEKEQDKVIKEKEKANKTDKSKNNDDFMKDYIEKQKRRSLAKDRKKDLGKER